MKARDKLKDIKEMAKVKNADIKLLLEDAYARGFTEGKEYAKHNAIEAIKNEYTN